MTKLSGIVSAVPSREAFVIGGGKNGNRSKAEFAILVHTRDVPGEQLDSGTLRTPASLAEFFRFDAGRLFQAVHPDYPHTGSAQNLKLRFAFGGSQRSRKRKLGLREQDSGELDRQESKLAIRVAAFIC